MQAEVTFDYRPLPIIAPFHADASRERLVVGGFGSGKSYALVAEAIAIGLEQAGSSILITRKTAPELKDTTEKVFQDVLPMELWAASKITRAGGHLDTVRLPNGSEFMFRSMDDWTKHKSMNLAFIAYDELDEFDEESYTAMLSRIRQTQPTPQGREYGAAPITRRGVIAATNPGGHDWVWSRFVNPASREPTTAYFLSTSLDNPYLPADYIEGLLRYPEPWVKRYVLAQFDDFAGQVYEEWNWEDHVVERREWPRGQLYWMGMDIGGAVPWAGLWVAVDAERQQLVGVAEYLQTGVNVSAHARNFRQLEARHKMQVKWRVADPNIRQRDKGSNMSLESQFNRYGFHFQMGPIRYQDRLPMLGQLIHQKRFVVTRDCPETYEQIKNYRWKDLTPQQRSQGVESSTEPVKAKDHLVDCAQYVCSRYVAPPRLNRLERPDASEFNTEVWRGVRAKIRSKSQPTRVLGGLA